MLLDYKLHNIHIDLIYRIITLKSHFVQSFCSTNLQSDIWRATGPSCLIPGPHSKVWDSPEDRDTVTDKDDAVNFFMSCHNAVFDYN